MGYLVYLQVPIYPIMRQRQSTFLGQCRGRVRLSYRNQSVSGDGRAVYFHDWRETGACRVDRGSNLHVAIFVRPLHCRATSVWHWIVTSG